MVASRDGLQAPVEASRPDDPHEQDVPSGSDVEMLHEDELSNAAAAAAAAAARRRMSLAESARVAHVREENPGSHSNVGILYEDEPSNAAAAAARRRRKLVEPTRVAHAREDDAGSQSDGEGWYERDPSNVSRWQLWHEARKKAGHTRISWVGLSSVRLHTMSYPSVAFDPFLGFRSPISGLLCSDRSS